MASYSANISLMANYADTSYFNDHHTIQIDPSSGSESICKRVAQLLTKWKKARTKTPPVEYRVWVQLHATYDDGRKADLGGEWHPFETIESALAHTSNLTTDQLKTLVEIGQDDV